MTKPTMIAAADIGYGSVKAMLKGGPIVYMPAGAAPAAHMPVRMDGTNDTPLDVRGVPYLAGFEQDMTQHQRHAAGRFAMSPDYHALFLETLGRLKTGHIETMVLGLPSREFDSDVKDYLKSTFAGSHVIRGTKVIVDTILVADQPLGTAALYYRDHEKALTRGRLLIIDIGYGTSDIALVVRGAVDRSISGSFDSAMKSLCEAMARNLSRPDAKVSPEWVDECLRSGERKVDIRGHITDMIEAANEPATEIASRIINNALGRLGSFASVTQVVVTGGGAILLGGPIKNLVTGPSVTVMDEPVTANLRGFIAMASTHD